MTVMCVWGGGGGGGGGVNASTKFCSRYMQRNAHTSPSVRSVLMSTIHVDMVFCRCNEGTRRTLGDGEFAMISTARAWCAHTNDPFPRPLYARACPPQKPPLYNGVDFMLYKSHRFGIHCSNVACRRFISVIVNHKHLIQTTPYTKRLTATYSYVSSLRIIILSYIHVVLLYQLYIRHQASYI